MLLKSPGLGTPFSPVPAGTVILSGADNYTGATIISDGTLLTANNPGIGNEGTTVIEPGATLQVGNGTATGNSTVNGDVLDNGTLALILRLRRHPTNIHR